MARLSEHGIRLSCMSPSYLNSNSTSHTWPFSAVAELVDNASDPGVTAKQIWIDVTSVKDQLCLSFTDNGSGMTPNKLHKMLSFGFTEKGNKKSHQPIGVYGNGFKSGSMRLGRDALIFTKNGGCLCVGMLSQSYLEAIHAQAVIVPIVPFSQQNKKLIVTEDSEASLQAILAHSIFTSQDELLGQFDTISSKKGTKILIWNIRRNKDGKPELDFDSDKHDIRMPPIHPEEMGTGGRKKFFGPHRTDQTTPELDYSLRAYLSILYLKPRTQIILRQKKVQTKLVAKSLTNIENDVYKPSFIKKKVKITFGFNGKNKEHFGIMMYHNNRLIKSYEKVGCQIKSSSQRSGIGVIGVIECNFLKPAHNKQDFEYTKEYRLTLAALGMKLNDYWGEMKLKKAKERVLRNLTRKTKNEELKDEDEQEVIVGEDDQDEEEEEEDESLHWIQCEDCLKWRRLPAEVTSCSLPERWTCSRHPNPRSRSCSLPEEAEESEEELTPSYEKSYKKHNNVGLAPNDSASAGISRDPGLERNRSKSLEEKTVRHSPLARGLSEPTIHPAGKPERVEEREETTEEKDAPLCRNKRKGHWLAYSTEKKTRPEPEKSVTGEEVENNTDEKRTSKRGEAETISVAQQTTPMELAKEEQFKLPLASSWPPVTAPAPAPAPAQMVVVPPLSRTEGRRPVPLGSEGMDRVATCQRVAQLEREADRLRRILGTPPLPRSPIREEPGPSDAMEQLSQERELLSQALAEAAEKLKAVSSERDRYKNKVTKLQQECTKLKEACDKSHQELLLMQSRPSGAQDKLYWGKKYANLQLHEFESLRAELERLQREKHDLESRLMQAEDSLCRPSDTPEQSASKLLNSHDSNTLECLRNIRQNVVALLPTILPLLDTRGISYDTEDVDNILRQIIEANGLRADLYTPNSTAPQL